MYSIYQSPFEILSCNENLYPILQRYELASKLTTPLVDLSEHSALIVELLNGLQHADDLQLLSFKSIATEELVDFLIRSHQYYTEKKIPELRLSLRNLKKFEAPEASHKEVALSVFETYVSQMVEHFEEEEQSLFPLFQNLDGQVCSNWRINQAYAKYIPEHQEVSHATYFNLIKELLSTSSKEKPCYFTEVFLRDLDTFKKDLQLHEWIEEQVLIPRFRL